MAAVQQIAVQSLTATDSTQLYSVALSKDLYAQRLYYNNSDSGLAIEHGLSSGTISLGFFGTNTAFVNVFKSADDRAVLSHAYGSVTSDLFVGRNATISGNAFIGTSLTVGSSLTVVANSFVNGSSTVSGSAYIGTNLIVNSTITGTALQITGPFASITGNVNIGTSLTVGSSLTVVANAFINGSSTISGSQYIGTNLIVNSTITGTALQITGPFASITGSVNIGTNITVGGNEAVLGSSTISGSQYIGSNLVVNNNASITNILYANNFVSNFGSITNLTAGHAIVMNDLIVEGSTSYINTTVTTFDDLNIQLGLNHVRTVVGTLSGGTFLLNGTEDGGTSAVPVGAFAVMNGPDQFTLGTQLGYSPILQVTTSTLTTGTYSVTFTKWDGGSQTAVASPSDIGFPSGYNFSQNITSLGQVASGAVYGKAGMTFNTYSTLSSGAYQNNTKSILFDDGNDRVNILNQNNEVVDMNIIGTKRTGNADTPYYCVNNNAVLNPNNLIIDTTFSTNSAIYLNASSTTTTAVGTWRMRIDSLNRVIWERLSSTGWRAAFKITSPF